MKSMFFGALAVALTVFTQSFGGAVEGAVNPVVDDVEISKMSPVDAISTRIWGSFEKLRQCDFLDIEFFLGVPGGASKALVVFEEGAKVRGDGREEFGPWIVQLTPEQIESNSFALVHHRCHFGWITETRFF